MHSIDSLHLRSEDNVDYTEQFKDVSDFNIALTSSLAHDLHFRGWRF